MKNKKGYYDGRRPDVVDFLPTSINKVLEIGCASGGFRANLGECEYWGVEYVESVANEAKNKLDTVLIGTFEEVYDQLPDNYFDTVICNDVIEHMADHDLFFEKIKAKMTAHSKILGSVPNVRYVDNLKELIFKKEWQYRDGGILDRTHLRFFTYKNLQKTLIEHNYKIETLEGINSALPKKITRIGRASSLRRLLVLLFGSDTKFLQFYFVAALDKL